MDFLNERLKTLNQSNYDELLQLVDELLKLPEDEQNRCWELLVKQEFLENQLNRVVSNADAKLLEFIANSCKNTTCRKFFSKDFFVKYLLELLDSNDFGQVKQTCRAIGNICYENELGCQMIHKNRGIQTIVDLLNLENLPDISAKERVQLKKMILGCLLNVLTVMPEYQAIAIDHDLVSLLADTLETETDRLTTESLVVSCVLVLFCFLENESSVEHLRNFRLLFALIDRLTSLNLKQIQTADQLDEIDLVTVESIIDLLMQLTNSEGETSNEFKLKLIEHGSLKGGIVELLIDILDHELIEEEQLLKTASSLVVTLISDKAIAKKYYANGKGSAYLHAKRWLDDYIDANGKCDDADDLIAGKENLRIKPNTEGDLIEKHDAIKQKVRPKDAIKENTQLVTSTLMIGNFSNNNEDSIQIARDGLIEKLVTIVESNEEMTIQFACLSSLRNLAIPEPNKVHFIANGFLTRLLRSAHSDTATVVFKYLATLRLISDKQPSAAFEIANNHKLIENLKRWGNLSGLTGVKAEASRLLASLFKHLDNTAFNCDHLMNGQLLRLLFEMVNSEYLKMQNEAVNGIGFLINKFEWNQIVGDLLKDETFAKSMKNLIRAYGEKEELSEFELKFVQNVLSVLSFGRLKYQLSFDSELYEEVNSLSANHPTLAGNVKMFLDLSSNQSTEKQS